MEPLINAFLENPLATAFGTAGLLCQLIWPLFHARRVIMTVQFGIGADYSLHYALLDAWSGAGVAGIGATQSALAFFYPSMPPGYCQQAFSLVREFSVLPVDGRQCGRPHKGRIFMKYRTCRYAAATLDAIFQPCPGAHSAWRWWRFSRSIGLQIRPLTIDVLEKVVHIHNQICNAVKAFQRSYNNRAYGQLVQLGDTGQTRGSVDLTGTGAAGTVMARVAVHERWVMLQADLFKTVQYACRSIPPHGNFKCLEARRINNARFVALDTKFKNFH